MGDFNARVQVKQDETEIPIGNHTFDPNNNLLHAQSDNTADNRNRCLTFCIAHNLKVMNTMFPKPEQYKYTYADPGAKGEPYKRHRYEILDYIPTTNEWKNTIRNTRTDPHHNINTRHVPVIAYVKVRLKAQYRQNLEARPRRIDYEPCKQIAYNEYNRELSANITVNQDYNTIIQTIKSTAKAHIPQKPHRPKQCYITR